MGGQSKQLNSVRYGLDIGDNAVQSAENSSIDTVWNGVLRESEGSEGRESDDEEGRKVDYQGRRTTRRRRKACGVPCRRRHRSKRLS